MKSQTKLVLGIAAFTLVMVGAAAGYRALSRKAPPAVEQSTRPAQEQALAADFAVEDSAGKTVRLSDMRGKPVVLNFWASWCYYCKEEMPGFEAAYQELGDDVQFMMVDLTDGRRETKEIGEAFISGQGYTFPVYYDTEGQAALAYPVAGIPATWFVSREGEVVHSVVGAMSEGALREGIARIR